LSGVMVLASSLGKFLIYAPASLGRRERLNVVSRAVSRVAKRLGLEIEISETGRVPSPYVFYLNRGVEEVPVYCDFGKNWDEDRIYKSIWSIVYTLSFLPEFNVLQVARRR